MVEWKNGIKENSDGKVERKGKNYCLVKEKIGGKRKVEGKNWNGAYMFFYSPNWRENKRDRKKNGYIKLFLYP